MAAPDRMEAMAMRSAFAQEASRSGADSGA